MEGHIESANVYTLSDEVKNNILSVMQKHAFTGAEMPALLEIYAALGAWDLIPAAFRPKPSEKK